MAFAQNTGSPSPTRSEPGFVGNAKTQGGSIFLVILRMQNGKSITELDPKFQPAYQEGLAKMGRSGQMLITVRTVDNKGDQMIVWAKTAPEATQMVQSECNLVEAGIVATAQQLTVVNDGTKSLYPVQKGESPKGTPPQPGPPPKGN